MMPIQVAYVVPLLCKHPSGAQHVVRHTFAEQDWAEIVGGNVVYKLLFGWWA